MHERTIIMKIKDGFVLKKVMGSYMIVAIDDSLGFNGMQTLNETGSFLWNFLQTDVTKDELLTKLLSEYDVDEATAKNDIDAFLSSLDKAGLLESR